MAFAKLIAFDRPLAGAVLPGRGGPLFTETEVAARAEAAYRKGVDATHSLMDQRLVDMRVEMEQLSDGVLRQLTTVEAATLAQLREALPALAIDIARRLLAGFEPPAALVEKLCHEALEQLFPEREGLELSLCPRDAALLEQVNPGWIARYPGLKVKSDANLAPGDCQVRSRFGLTDARQSTKLAVLSHGLTGE
ncbi:flagellar assembly protein H [Lacunisphaera limnophila]|uniref:Flagellar assembly protein FliH n=1 Tax=Lacunisphaera limnophila TaxID=1838286 RepID=A0A1D8AW41_9BACT|nr:FliH/SctL family protein [Lacunisphaera limnophila]AOS45110.1 flagellar assembly protein H [Lacunisphaera limnophila]